MKPWYIMSGECLEGTRDANEETRVLGLWFMVYGSDKKPSWFFVARLFYDIKTFAADYARECVLVSSSFASHKISRLKKNTYVVLLDFFNRNGSFWFSRM